MVIIKYTKWQILNTQIHERENTIKQKKTRETEKSLIQFNTKNREKLIQLKTKKRVKKRSIQF